MLIASLRDEALPAPLTASSLAMVLLRCSMCTARTAAVASGREGGEGDSSAARPATSGHGQERSASRAVRTTGRWWVVCRAVGGRWLLVYRAGRW